MGLPVYRIVIKEKDLKQMESQIWSDRFVPATMSNGSGSEPVRIRYRGGHTREYPKKSYEIRTSRVTYHYNAEHDDPSLLRNALSFHFFNTIGVPSPATQHCVLQLNGETQGVYLRIEAVNQTFFRVRKIQVRSIIYAVNDNATFDLNKVGTDTPKSSLFSGYSLIRGTGEDRQKLIRFIRDIHAKRGRMLQKYLGGRLYMDNYLKWLSGAVLTGNYDGFQQNYTIFEYKKRKAYGFLPWDYEGTWGRNCYGKSVASDLVRIEGYNRLTGKVLAFSSYRQQYKKRLEDILASAFTVQQLMPVVRRMFNQIEDDVYRDPKYKWPRGMFISEPDVIQAYIEDRRKDIRRELQNL
ncbi:CotH kinase family protein [Paenibacillus dokdonensis]|uniref:CotH kinase family protein n=1 Tax=Paenibacillus dokdonensis TaxID=2567944 RepID=A0ABU6GMZ4_9BACL|nr:CotH kinase family protein [Paenibacillus dokdonensis]MEC0241115.1 CotH kinase family protein [Paenibacillus dokdonensis]